ncbi:MAG: L-histidine N(alpha)-methyltransferase [Christensenellaceae bacterium]|jgi:uncharacterized SAM-dependent methyltransferase|nr:L-histidine N(alpha)-methyltransferase [Christensenellaceae bacterium]
MKEAETKEVLNRLKEAIKKGEPLNDSAFWYLSNDGIDGLFAIEQDEEYKKVAIPSVTQDMLAIAKYIAEKHADKKHIIFTDWGCGNGQISKIITEYLIKEGFDLTYMPIDISQKELDVACIEHKFENIVPVLSLFENLKDYFPLKSVGGGRPSRYMAFWVAL